MIDLKKVEKYRENNRIEAKKALGGLPHSIWETYSAFANTLGGVILLGVEEYKDKSFHVIDLPDPEGLVREFVAGLNDRKKVSINILSKKDIKIEKYDGKSFISINIPRANRFDKPIYIEGNMNSGTYRRGGEGDYRCSADEIEAMLREAKSINDPTPMIDFLTLDESTLSKYTESVAEEKKSEILPCDKAVFSAEKSGTVSTAALLMLGRIEAIKEYFPHFSTHFVLRDEAGSILDEATDMNLYDFYLHARNHIEKSICLLGKNRKEEKEIIAALNEALINSLIHADYHLPASVKVEISPYEITFINPGSLRVSPSSVVLGGISDRRNEELARLFYICGFSTEMGGIKGIYEVWRKNKWCPPSIEEHFSPDKIVIKLTLGKASLDSAPMTSEVSTMVRRTAAIGYITEHIEVTGGDIASLLGISRESAVQLLRSLADEEILVFEKRGKEYFYKLKS